LVQLKSAELLCVFLHRGERDDDFPPAARPWRSLDEDVVAVPQPTLSTMVPVSGPPWRSARPPPTVESFPPVAAEGLTPPSPPTQPLER